VLGLFSLLRLGTPKYGYRHMSYEKY
jgi:hypothetical protein